MHSQLWLTEGDKGSCDLDRPSGRNAGGVGHRLRIFEELDISVKAVGEDHKPHSVAAVR